MKGARRAQSYQENNESSFHGADNGEVGANLSTK
jgi:hypothetical protein